MKHFLRKNLLFITLFTIIALFCYTSPFEWFGEISGQHQGKLNQPSLSNMVTYPKILEDHKAQSISYVEKYSTKNRDFLMGLFNKGKDFFPKVSGVFTELGLPTELNVLIAIESQFKSNAVSPAGAVGYWQLMGDVARGYGLRTGKNDDRKDLDKSTAAAGRYLKDACNEFGNNILLAVASYNCGDGNVRKAIKRSGVESATFWDIKNYLPKETQLYVMNFITLNVIFKNYDKFSNGKLQFQQPLTASANYNGGQSKS